MAPKRGKKNPACEECRAKHVKCPPWHDASPAEPMSQFDSLDTISVSSQAADPGPSRNVDREEGSRQWEKHRLEHTLKLKEQVEVAERRVENRRKKLTNQLEGDKARAEKEKEKALEALQKREDRIKELEIEKEHTERAKEQMQVEYDQQIRRLGDDGVEREEQLRELRAQYEMVNARLAQTEDCVQPFRKVTPVLQKLGPLLQALTAVSRTLTPADFRILQDFMHHPSFTQGSHADTAMTT